jgi:hypothetical protein
METKAIKSYLRDLSKEDLIKKKQEISDFLFNHKNVETAMQGNATLIVINDLIEAKEAEDEFKEDLLKELFFE